MPIDINKGPGGVNASYGRRSTSSVFNTSDKYDQGMFIDSKKRIIDPSGEVIVTGADSAGFRQIVSKFKRGRKNPSEIRVVGDSYGLSQGASNSAVTGWIPRIVSRYSSLFTDPVVKNSSVSGVTTSQYVVDNATGASHRNISEDAVILSVVGLNQVRTFNLTNDTVLKDTRIATQAMLARFAVPDRMRFPVRLRSNNAVLNTQTGVSFRGTWNLGFGGGRGAVCPIGGGMDVSPGYEFDTVYVIAFGSNGSNAKITVQIDGVTEGVFDSKMSYNGADGGGGWDAMLFKVHCRKGVHSIAVNGSADNLFLCEVMAFDSNTVNGPLVVAGSHVNLPDAGWAVPSFGVTPNDPAAVSGTFSANWLPKSLYGAGGAKRSVEAVRDAVNAMQDDGLNVVFVDVHSYFDPELHISADTVHPNDDGYTLITTLMSQPLSLLG